MPNVTGTIMITAQTTCEKTALQRKKALLLSTVAFMAGAMLVPGSAMAQVATPTNSWDYDVVLDGNVGKDVSTAGLTNITVNGGNGYVEGNANIYTGHTVNVTGDNGATFAYRDNRDNIQSTLDGNLNSNMKVVIIDKDGLFFMNGSSINVQSLVATTGNIRVNDVMNGGNVLTIRNVSEDGIIVNKGTITAKKSVDLIAKGILNSGDIVVTKANGRILLAAADQVQLKKPNNKTSIDVSETGIVINIGTMTVAKGGLAALVSPFAGNAGVINAKMGTVAMAAGESVTLDMYGDGLVEVAVDGELANAMLVNVGEIQAEGGRVQITAKAAKGTLDNVINNSGVITASSASVDGGKIILDGGDRGTVYNRGMIETSAGGAIEISGERFKQNEPMIIVPATKPSIGVKSFGGNIDITTTENVEIYAGVVDAAGGNINIDNGGVFYSKDKDTILTSGVGTIEINQNQDAFLSASAIAPVRPTASIQNVVDAIGNTGTGTNTINVSAGTFVEDIKIDQSNTILNGANHGLNGTDATRGAETLILASTNGNGVKIVADNVTVDGVAIDGGRAGVYVDKVDNATILNNVISNQYHSSGNGNSMGSLGLGDGVYVQNSAGTIVDGNLITDMNDDGIHALYVSDFTATNNTIIDDGLKGDEGIAVAYATGITTISDNTISDARRDGIQVHTASGEVNIVGNTIEGSSVSGVSIVNTTGSVQIDGNTINGGISGVDVNGSASVVVGGTQGNDIDNVGHGIITKNTRDVDILNNNIQAASIYGIRAYGFANADVSGNVIDNVINGSGMYLSGTQSSITGNTVTNTALDGIVSNHTSDTNISGNIVEFAGFDGISVFGNDVTVIDNNTINQSGSDGVQAYNAQTLEVTNNTIDNSLQNGVNVDGPNNGEVLFEGNILTDNGQDTGFAHVRFESGNIDLSNLSNPNTITNTTANNAIGLQFISGGSTPLTIAGETLGATEFTGFIAAGNFYVRFEDGAILNPITNAPIIIDGTDASFDGVIPGSFAGEVLPVATLNFIENRLYDADDATVNGRGQIFAGTPEVIAAGLSNFQDFFFTPETGVAPAGGASVRITGLPSTGVLNLNNIAPAAGEGENVANIEPAAGGDGDQGNDVTCLGDAVNSLGAGTVNYNFGGSLQDSIVGASACANAAL